MKIVTKKKMRYDELIKAVFEGRIDVSDGHYFCDTQDAHMIVSDGGVFSNYRYTSADTFTVGTEEELTEDTKLGEYGRLLIIHRDFNKKDLLYCDYTPTQDIGFTRKTHESNYKLEAICLLTRKAEMITVWSAEHGIPTEGTLEL